jgi:hypothetical protein
MSISAWRRCLLGLAPLPFPLGELSRIDGAAFASEQPAEHGSDRIPRVPIPRL